MLCCMVRLKNLTEIISHDRLRIINFNFSNFMNSILKQSVFLFLLAVMSVSFFGCSENEVTEEVQEIQEIENIEVVENQEDGLSEKDEVDTSDWETYKNDEFGFEVKHPKDWKIKKVKTSSKYFSLNPISCTKTPEECKFEMIQFSNGSGIFVNIRKYTDRNFKKDIINKKSSLMTDIVEGCLVVSSTKGKDGYFSLSSFLDSDNLSEFEKEKFNESCQKNELGGSVDLMAESFKVLQ